MSGNNIKVNFEHQSMRLLGALYLSANRHLI